MKSQHREIEFAIEVFVRGHSAGKSRTFPYEADRVGSLWVMRDAPRRNPRDYRKEEWIAHHVDAIEVDPKAAAKHLGGDALQTLAKVREQLAGLARWDAAAIHTAPNDLATQIQSGLGKIAQPLRVAVSGTAVSPPIDVTLALLGRERTLARVDAVLVKSPPDHA